MLLLNLKFSNRVNKIYNFNKKVEEGLVEPGEIPPPLAGEFPPVIREAMVISKSSMKKKLDKIFFPSYKYIEDYLYMRSQNGKTLHLNFSGAIG